MISTISGQPAQALALAAYPRQDPRCLARAFRGGVNYFFFYGPGNRDFIEALAQLAKKKRDDLIIATGSGSRKPTGLKATRRKLMAAAGTNVIDVFYAEYVSEADRPETIFGPGGVLDELQQWKAQGVIRYVGATAHHRGLAAQLAADARVDVLMHRFNMAHRKAAIEVLPAAQQHKTPVVAFTATRWGTLLEAPPGWEGPVPTAADCYRYCLAQPAIKLVLSAPKTLHELSENLAVLDSPQMAKRERVRWEKFGDRVRGEGQDQFETLWP